MENNAIASRIHPLFAAAAVSVIALSGTGIAAMTGLLPSSKAETAAQAMPAGLAAQQAPVAGQGFDARYPVATPSNAQQLSLQAPQQAGPVLEPALTARQPAVQAAPERTVVREIVYREPAPRKVVHRAPERSREASAQPTYAPAPAPQESRPNYVAIGTGAVVGGLLGNQVGSGNGKKLATLAGIIGGGYVGNEIANRNR